jgi:hypothetical protein
MRGRVICAVALTLKSHATRGTNMGSSRPIGWAESASLGTDRHNGLRVARKASSSGRMLSDEIDSPESFDFGTSRRHQLTKQACSRAATARHTSPCRCEVLLAIIGHKNRTLVALRLSALICQRRQLLAGCQVQHVKTPSLTSRSGVGRPATAWA